MRPLLLASPLLVVPALALAADQQCVLPPPGQLTGEPALALPAPIRAVAAPAAPTVAPAPTPTATSAPASAPAAPEPGSGTPNAQTADLGKIPVLARVAAAGAQLTDLGVSHGMRTVLARNRDELMVLEVAPDGQAAVAGLMADLSAAQLLAAAGGNATEIGTRHGLRTVFVRSGTQFQVFYATPDGERVIPGVLYDADGKNLTRDQVSGIPGAIPTVTIGEGAGAGAPAPAQAAAQHSSAQAAAPGGGSLLAAVQGTSSGTVGSAGAPQLWVFIDPQCSFSVRAMQQLQPYVASGRVRLSIVPISVLDYEDQGRSTASALAMLSKPEEQMVAAWMGGQLTGAAAPGAAAPESAAKLQANMAAAQAIGLRGTPTFVWRKADGTEGRADGVPNDLGAVIASIGS